MKVKIAYTVDMEDVPIKSAELLEYARNSLEKALESASDAFDKMGLDKDSLATLEAIDKARKEMFQADALLEDVAHIVASYGQLVLAQNSPAPPADANVTDPAFFDNMLEEVSDGG